MSIAPHRLLGFAFASADLLLELGSANKIEFAIGAVGVIAAAGERALIGRSLLDMVDRRDQPLLSSLIAGAKDSCRQGPVTARLAVVGQAPQRAFSISICKLPQNGGSISCALARSASPQLGAGAGGLHDRQGLEVMARGLFETARTTGEELELSFVEMEGLDKAAATLTDESQARLRVHIAGAIRAQAHGGAAAAQLDGERYALVRAAGEPPEVLVQRLERLLSMTKELGEVKFGAHSMALQGDASPSQVVRALRYALDDFIEGGVGAVAQATLGDAVSDSVRHTMKKASELGAAVAEGRFKLVYQPVVTLKTGLAHHHEVLVRFGEHQSPFPLIRMAEELDLIEALDLAVAHRAAAEMALDPKLKLAVNVSGRTITSPGFIAKITALVQGQAGLRGRLMFEITESATIDDLMLADRHIQSMRGLGCQVCLDDFGAGAASLAYLQQLSFDFVKIDGRYIRELQHGGRESTFLRHLVRMCAELKVKTVAEMVENASAEEAVRRAGIEFGQGYFYGAPTERPGSPADRSGPAAARRVGAVESWG